MKLLQEQKDRLAKDKEASLKVLNRIQSTNMTYSQTGTTVTVTKMVSMQGGSQSTNLPVKHTPNVESKNAVQLDMSGIIDKAQDEEFRKKMDDLQSRELAQQAQKDK